MKLGELVAALGRNLSPEEAVEAATPEGLERLTELAGAAVPASGSAEEDTEA